MYGEGESCGCRGLKFEHKKQKNYMERLQNKTLLHGLHSDHVGREKNCDSLP